MKKFLVLPLWIFLGLLVPTILGMILPKLFNENIAIFGTLIFILCIYMGFRNFNKIKSVELAKKLVDIYSYSENSVAAMSQQEITLRFDMHKNSSIDELHNLSYEELKNKKSVAEKDRRKASHEKNVKELKESFEDVKVKAINLKNTYEVGAADVKKSFDELSKSKQEMVEAFTELKSETKKLVTDPFYMGKIFEFENSNSNSASNSKSDSPSQRKNSESSQASSELLESSHYYKQIIFDIRKCEDKIEELKIKIDNAKSYREKCLPFDDSVNRRLVEQYDKEIFDFGSDIRVIEKELHELVLRKRQEEDRAKREADRKN